MDQLEEIKSKIDIVQLISEYLPLKKAGRNFKALCPFHAEKTPSFMVSPERQIFKCFGCGAGGDIFGFLMQMEGMEFGEALRILAKRAGVSLRAYQPTRQEEAKEKLYQLNSLAAEYFHYILLSHPAGKKAASYLENRGIKESSIKTFKIGYAPNSFDSLKNYLLQKKKYQPEELLQAGLASKTANGFFDFFRDRVMFPLRDHRGNFVGFAGRVVGPWDETGAKGPKYINTPETLVYQKGNLLYGFETTKNAIKAKNQAVVVEGELDLISSYQAGIENVIAIKGSSLTEFQVKLIKRFCENIALALDMDLAGDKATWRGVEIADREGLNIRVVRLPEGKDPDELARKDPESLKKALEAAVPAYDFFLDSAFARFDPESPEGKRKIGMEILPVLAKISDELVKAFYVQKFANRLAVPVEAALQQMAKISQPLEEKETLTVLSAKKEAPRREVLEKYLFALILQSGSLKYFEEKEFQELIQTPSLRRLLALLAKKSQAKNFKSQSFAKDLPAELIDIFNSFYLYDFGDKIENSSWSDREIRKTINELKKEILRSKIQDLSAKISQTEKEKDAGNELTKLEEEFKILSLQLAKINGEQV